MHKVIVSLVVAAAENGAIGKDNQLLWHLPKDLQFFKHTTWGFPVIMGRKTFESVGSKPLPGRLNIVVSANKDWLPNEATVLKADSIENAIRLAVRELHVKEVFVIGGGAIYAAAYPLADRIILTRVRSRYEGDVFFQMPDENEFELVWSASEQPDEKHTVGFQFERWERKHL